MIRSLKIVLKSDSEGLWRENNPVLRSGEIAVSVFPTQRLGYKVGDGVRAYKDLPWLCLESALNDGLIYASKDGHGTTVSIQLASAEARMRADEESAAQINERNLLSLICNQTAE